jgi:FkbM family methyltransferase
MRTFLEIGSCDFETLNFLADHNWRGAIVEPMSKYLNRLERKQAVLYLNYAIDNEDGFKTLYEYPEDVIASDNDYSGMSSFYNRSKGMIEHNVPTITYARLLKICEFDEIEYLKIDTEGHDEIILGQVMAHPIKPKQIKVEHKYCNRNKMVELLKSHDYSVNILEQDLFATLYKVL